MKILITGGAGFIGSNFVRYILENHSDYEVVVLDKLLHSGRIESLKDVMNKITFIKGDICKKDDVEKAIHDCNFVVNFAAQSHVDRSIIEAGSFIYNEVLGTYRLLQSARSHNIEKFVQIGTDEVYGSTKINSFKEVDNLDPSNPYSASKAGADLFVRVFYKTYDMFAMITRSGNNYGPYQHPEKFIAKTIIYALLNKKIPIYGKGNNIRDWIFVMDNCKAIDLVLHKGKKGEIYNIGGSQEFDNITIAKNILKLLSKPDNLIEFVEDRPGHDFRYSMNIEKIKKLGWSPKITLDVGLEKTTDWYIKNEWWWKPILQKQQIDFHLWWK
jgi:dTDP-glucose 4,6-dehydratase